MASRPRLPSYLAALVREFETSLPTEYAPVTRRVYVAAARQALRLIAPALTDEIAPGTLFLMLHDARWTKSNPRPRRLERFLGFLAQAYPAARLDLSSLKEKIIQGIGEGTRNVQMPTLRQRRNLAFLAALCAAPRKVHPRSWRRECLRVQGRTTYLWGEPVAVAELAEALRLWAAWRDRLAHEAPRRAIRRPPKWGESPWLFPGRTGKMMAAPRAHAVLKEAIISCLDQNRALIAWPGGLTSFGPLPLTPALVRRAFDAVECWPDVPLPLVTSAGAPVPTVPTPVRPVPPGSSLEPETNLRGDVTPRSH
ncbi:MAG: hypothetical protein JOY92_03200 [Verrucomicrobia bacterium]|nr:hypothetical protein [Verrucomicrobiota bacterium]